MNGTNLRMKIEYVSETSLRFHTSQLSASSSFDLFDRILRLRTKAVSAIHVYVKLEGYRDRWLMVATSWRRGLFMPPYVGRIDPSLFPDKEYMEGVAVSAYERAVEIRKKDDSKNRGTGP